MCANVKSLPYADWWLGIFMSNWVNVVLVDLPCIIMCTIVCCLLDAQPSSVAYNHLAGWTYFLCVFLCISVFNVECFITSAKEVIFCQTLFVCLSVSVLAR